MNTIILERLKLLLLAFVITTVAQAQTYSIEPSGYTTPVYENVTCTNSYGNTYTVHGQGVIVAKAIVSGRTATFIIKKVSGTFSKAGHVYVRADNPCGKQLGSKAKYSVGSSMVSVDYPLDFSSGSRTFVLRAVSSANEVFYTRPITIKVVDASPRKSDLYLQSAMGFSGATSLVRGNTYKFSARIVNKGTAAYTGNFYLKHGDVDLKSWYDYTISAGSSTTLSFDYTPTQTGSLSLALYSQEGRTGSGRLVKGDGNSNPITISVKDNISSLPSPDFRTFTVTDITENSFVANWKAIPGATQYNILVKRASDKDYSNPVVRAGSSTSQYKVSGLQPGTAYHFQVQAINHSTKSEWSKSIATAVTTKEGKAHLMLSQAMSFQGHTTLELGKSYVFSARVINDGKRNWRGAFYLKEGNEDVKSWGGQTVNSGHTITLTFNYTPTKTGQHALTLYYQEGGTGTGLLVGNSAYANPITIVVKGQTNDLATPDSRTFSASAITSNSFLASWAPVAKATQYEVLVKRASDSDYSKPVVQGGSSTPQYKVVGLQPGTAYHFQVQAKNGSLKSGWSKSIATPVVTVAGVTSKEDLFLSENHGFGSTELITGKVYSYRAKVKNNGTKNWSGAFYLKSQDGNILSWYETINAGEQKVLTGNWSPTVSGVMPVYLYYQTGGRGSGVLVGKGNYNNPLHLTITGSSPKIKLGSAIKLVPAELSIGESAVLSASIANTGNAAWTGILYFYENGKIIKSRRGTIAPGETKNITCLWSPNSTGRKELKMAYLTDGGNSREDVLAGNYSNPLVVTVANKTGKKIDEQGNIDEPITLSGTYDKASHLVTLSWNIVNGINHYVILRDNQRLESIFEGRYPWTFSKTFQPEPGVHKYQVVASNVSLQKSSNVLAVNVPEKTTSQRMYGKILGVIKDSSGELVDGVEVAILTANGKLEKVSSVKGRFITGLLPYGKGTITCSKDGYTYKTEKAISYELNQDLLNLAITVNKRPDVIASSSDLMAEAIKVKKEYVAGEVQNLNYRIENLTDKPWSGDVILSIRSSYLPSFKGYERARYKIENLGPGQQTIAAFVVSKGFNAEDTECDIVLQSQRKILFGEAPLDLIAPQRGTELPLRIIVKGKSDYDTFNDYMHDLGTTLKYSKMFTRVVAFVSEVIVNNDAKWRTCFAGQFFSGLEKELRVISKPVNRINKVTSIISTIKEIDRSISNGDQLQLYLKANNIFLGCISGIFPPASVYEDYFKTIDKVKKHLDRITSYEINEYSKLNILCNDPLSPTKYSNVIGVRIKKKSWLPLTSFFSPAELNNEISEAKLIVYTKGNSIPEEFPMVKMDRFEKGDEKTIYFETSSDFREAYGLGRSGGGYEAHNHNVIFKLIFSNGRIMYLPLEKDICKFPGVFSPTWMFTLKADTSTSKDIPSSKIEIDKP